MSLARPFPQSTFDNGGTVPGTGRVNIISPMQFSNSSINDVIDSGIMSKPDPEASINRSKAFRNRKEANWNQIEQMDVIEIESLIYDIPHQLDISPTDTLKKSNLIIINNKSTSKKNGEESEGTIFDHRMGSLSHDNQCKTCNRRECQGHSGRILFPPGIMIPYSHFMNVIINIVKCICIDCSRPLLRKEQMEKIGVYRCNGKITALSRFERLTRLSKASKNLSCSNNRPNGAGMCGKKIIINKEGSKTSGFVIYTETIISDSEKVTHTIKLSGLKLDTIFRELSQESLEYLGFTDIEDLCALLAVGIIVPPIPVRPFVAKFDKAKNPINDQLAKIVAENEALKLAIERKNTNDLYQGGQNTRFVPISELESARNTMHNVAGIASHKSSMMIEKLRASILEARQRLQETPYNPEKQETIDLLRQQAAQINASMSTVTNNLQYQQLQYQLSGIQQNIQQIEQTIQSNEFNNQLRAQIESYENNIQQLLKLSQQTSDEYTQRFQEIDSRISAGNRMSSMKKSEEDISTLITNLYVAFKQYILLMESKVRDKKEDLRRRGMGKHAYYVGRAVASPGFNVEIGEIEIPEYLAPMLGVIINVTAYSIVEAQCLLDAGKITYLKRTGNDDEVNDMLVKSGKFILMEGDVVVRHLRDGDPVVAVRMPTLHRNNMLAFRARIVKGSMSIRVHMVWTTGYNLDFDGDEISLYVPQGDAIPEVMNSMYAPLNLISPRSGLPIGGAVYNTISAWYLATHSSTLISEQTWIEALIKLTGRKQLGSFHRRMYERNITERTGAMLFSMMLPEDFNYPNYGDKPIKGVVIESGILMAGTLTKTHLAPGRPNSLIQALYFSYGHKDFDVIESFVNDMYTLAYLFQHEYGQTITAEDCAYGEHKITIIGENKEQKAVIANIIGTIKPLAYYVSVVQNVDGQIPYPKEGDIEEQKEYTQTIEQIAIELMNNTEINRISAVIRKQYPQMLEDNVLRLAQTVLIEKQIQSLGVLFPELEDDIINEYDRIIMRVRNISLEEAIVERKSYVIGYAAKIEGDKKLALVDTKIKMLGPVPTDKTKRNAYENQITAIISSELGNVGVDTAMEVRKFISNNLLDMTNDFGAGAKGTSANVAMMGGHIGGQQIMDNPRMLPCITGNTRCMTTQYPNAKTLDVGGYISNSLNSGMTPVETMQMAQGNRAGMAGTVTQTANSGLFNKLLCKAMEQLVAHNGAVISQDGKLYQYMYGEDGLSSTKLTLVDDQFTFVDMKSIADRINYKFGWELKTVIPDKEIPYELLPIVKEIARRKEEHPELSDNDINQQISSEPEWRSSYQQLNERREYMIKYIYDTPSYTNPYDYRPIYKNGYNDLRKKWFVHTNVLLSEQSRNVLAELHEYIRKNVVKSRSEIENIFSNEYPQEMAQIREIYQLKGDDYWVE